MCPLFVEGIDSKVYTLCFRTAFWRLEFDGFVREGMR